MQKQWSAPFSVKYMEDLKTLDQPMGTTNAEDGVRADEVRRR
jgi:hypothetical protein